MVVSAGFTNLILITSQEIPSRESISDAFNEYSTIEPTASKATSSPSVNLKLSPILICSNPFFSGTPSAEPRGYRTATGPSQCSTAVKIISLNSDSSFGAIITMPGIILK